MKKVNAAVVALSFLMIGAFLLFYSYKLGILFLFFLALMEILSYLLVNKLRENFQWMITPKDELPILSKDGLKKFIKSGYDGELGWTRKPNTEKEEIGKDGKTKYHIDSRGSRKNPDHGKLPIKISFYGDSFLFARQVNDNETCQWHLSELTKTNILNFSVGNYGLDQALLRLKREYPKNRTKIVVMGVVPSTIVRVLCVWKHYNEFGNTFGFKPRFVLEKGNLKLIGNFIDKDEKFLEYQKYLPKIKKYDYFYKIKFRREMIEFPYSVSLLSDPFRNFRIIFYIFISKLLKLEKEVEVYPLPMKVIMEENLKLRYNLFTKDRYALKLMEKIAEEFAAYARKEKFIPIFLFMPQKDDLFFIRKKGLYYANFIKAIKKKMYAIDLTEYLLERNDLDEVYSDDNEYGGHYSNFGNEVIARIIHGNLREKGVLKAIRSA